MSSILQGLNDKQTEAVKTTDGPVLVISGPGSGKTRCLTHRIAYLMQSGIPAEHILAVTFTNKAAQEIKERIQGLLGKHASYPTLGTFHALGLRILRREITTLGYGANFTIIDSSDQQALMKRVITSLALDPKRFGHSSMLARVQKLKTDLLFPGEFKPSGMSEEVLARVYAAYQSELARMNGVDFGDLILLPVRIFRKHPEILERYQHGWKYILVDEYQDTSHDQYTLVTMLAAKNRNIFCIGDDAQSIYQFRQADIRNILNFQRDYPEGKVVLLEQNYRSTKTILAAAQAIISNNKGQIPKELWTNNISGELVTVVECVSEKDEARHIAATLERMRAQRYTLADCAILYRTHAQSRAIEEQLVRSAIPYRIVGGIRFYERREIKDLLAYLRIIHNRTDSISLERIANVPPRGIGDVTFARIIGTKNPDLIAAIAQAAEDHSPTSRSGSALRQLHGALAQLSSDIGQKTPSQLLRDIIKTVNYESYIRSLKGGADDTIEDRLENIQEFLTVAARYDVAGPEGLAQFLEEVALLQEAARSREGERTVTLMTIHAAKGLEFPVVIVAGMEEGLFPHSRTIYAPHELEEERRLCYVALTRAKDLLFITFARWRSIFGARHANIPSRFLGEIPEALLTWQKLDSDFSSERESYVDYDE